MRKRYSLFCDRLKRDDNRPEVIALVYDGNKASYARERPSELALCGAGATFYRRAVAQAPMQIT